MIAKVWPFRQKKQRSRVTQIMLYQDTFDDNNLRVLVARDGQLACDGNRYTNISKASAKRLSLLTYLPGYKTSTIFDAGLTIFIKPKRG